MRARLPITGPSGLLPRPDAGYANDGCTRGGADGLVGDFQVGAHLGGAGSSGGGLGGVVGLHGGGRCDGEEAGKLGKFEKLST
jgi:hypothetical protein